MHSRGRPLHNVSVPYRSFVLSELHRSFCRRRRLCFIQLICPGFQFFLLIEIEQIFCFNLTLFGTVVKKHPEQIFCLPPRHKESRRVNNIAAAIERNSPRNLPRRFSLFSKPVFAPVEVDFKIVFINVTKKEADSNRFTLEWRTALEKLFINRKNCRDTREHAENAILEDVIM